MKKTTNYSKFVASAATATLVASAVVPAAFAQDMKFTDVGDRYKEAVTFLSENNITQGISDTQFGTQQSIKRVDVAVLLAKATLTTEEIESAPASGFSDVPSRAVKYVNALKAKGIANGKTTTSFGANSPITRGEAAIMLSKAYGIEGDAANVSFSDVAPRYKDAVAALVDNNITNGKTANRFGTVDSITRGELAIFLYKLETRDETPAPELKVEGVEAVSATQVQVKFTDAVNPATLFANAKTGEFKDGVFTMSRVGNANETGELTGMLSTDGKTLTVQTKNALEGKYTVIANGLKTMDNKDIEKYQEIVTIAKDEKAPTVVSVDKVNASQYNVVFSEPMKDLGTLRYTNENGTVYGDDNIDNSFNSGDSEVLFTLPSGMDAGKKVNVEFANAKDMADNTIAANSATATFTKGEKDGTPPTVGNIAQTGAKEFTVEFSEQLAGKPEINLSGGTVKTVEKDASNPLKYVVTTNEVLDGSLTVTVNNYTDLSGETGAESSRLITFTKDTAAPEVTSTKVIKDKDGDKELLEITFDKKVNVSEDSKVKIAGTYLRTDGVTQNVNKSAVVAKVEDDAAKVVVELGTLLNDADSEGAKYNVNLSFENLASAYDVDAAAKDVTFTRGKDAAAENAELVKVTKIEQDAVDNTKVNVTFDKKVDGSTALNTANYSINGVAVQSVTLNEVVKGKGKAVTQTAVLQLASGSIADTGDRFVKISNIKAEGSTKSMEPITEKVEFKENVAPVIESAVMTVNGTIDLTFSEAVTGSPINMEVLAGDKTVANKVKTTLNSKDKTKATVVVTGGFSEEELAQTITIQPAEGNALTDEKGNALTTGATVKRSR